jgi:hypothetical protein
MYKGTIYNITKIDNDNKLTFKLLKINKQVTITYLSTTQKDIINTIKKNILVLSKKDIIHYP